MPAPSWLELVAFSVIGEGEAWLGQHPCTGALGWCALLVLLGAALDRRA